jgi:hypothetical protein
MPNNGIISRQAVIPDEFLVESADPTDLVIINTPTTGNKVQQKAVPVSALGGGGAAPYYSFVYRLHLLSDLSDDSTTIYNTFPSEYDLFVAVQPGATSNDLVAVNIIDNNDVANFDVASVTIDSYTSSRIHLHEKSASEIQIKVPSLANGGQGADFLINRYVNVEIKYYYNF